MDPNSENGFSHNINKVLCLNKTYSHSHIVPVLSDIRSLETHSSTGKCANTIQTWECTNEATGGRGTVSCVYVYLKPLAR